MTVADGVFRLTTSTCQGRVSGMLYSLPIYAVLVENLGERGAHYMALKLFHELESGKLTKALADAPAAKRHPEGESIAPEKSAALATSCTGCSVVSNLLWMAVGAGSVALFVWLKNKRN